jgi:hypothetical protein
MGTRSLSPEQIKIIYTGDVGNPQDKFDKQGMSWANSVDLSTSIEVSVNDEGEFCLEDGHHRWFAAQKTQRMLTASVEVKGRPIEYILRQQEISCSPASNRSRLG